MAMVSKQSYPSRAEKEKAPRTRSGYLFSLKPCNEFALKTILQSRSPDSVLVYCVSLEMAHDEM